VKRVGAILINDDDDDDDDRRRRKRRSRKESRLEHGVSGDWHGWINKGVKSWKGRILKITQKGGFCEKDVWF